MARPQDPGSIDLPPRQPPGELDVTRREFFKTVGVGSVAAAVTGVGSAAAQGPPSIGPGEVAVALTINGQRHTLNVEPRVTLLDAMRTRLDITGLKRVCDRGSCGACTVIIDGRTYYSCSLLAIETQGRNIRTVEGLSQGSTLHPVQQSFCDHDALMCGFCTPGFVMATVAMLKQTPSPTTAQAKRGLDGNICRCGTNIGVLAAALAPGVPGAMGASGAVRSAGAPGALRCGAGCDRCGAGAVAAPTGHASQVCVAGEITAAGHADRRLDGPLKTTGRAKYTFDITRPGMIFGKILRSPHAHARVKSLDLSAAATAPAFARHSRTSSPAGK